jgi:hypothetical protein
MSSHFWKRRLFNYYRYWLVTGRSRPLPSEQTGKSWYPGDDGQIPETEVSGFGAAASITRTGNIRSRIQAVHRTSPRAVGRTVDGRAAAKIRPKDDLAPGIVCEKARPDGEPSVVVIVFFPGRTAEYQCRSHKK